MKKIYIWGTGKKSAEVFDTLIFNKIKFVGFIDNDPSKWEQKLNGYQIFSFEEIKSFDYIVISVVDFQALEYQLVQSGVPNNKIIFYYKDTIDKYDFIDNKKREINILKEQLTSTRRMLENRIANMPYENIKPKIPIPTIGNNDDAVRQIVHEHKSMIRFGDGEFNIISQTGNPVFQVASIELANKLKEILQQEHEKLIIAIADNYSNLDKYTDEVADGIRYYMTEDVRKFHNSLLNINRTYYDAYMFKCYYPYKDKEKTLERLLLIKQIWNGRKVVIVEGNLTRTGVDNDLLSETIEIKRIICPTINAYEKYNRICQQCMKMEKDYLFLIALGPAGKVLAYDLFKSGYQVVDIGQIDMDYEWYLMGAKFKIPNWKKYVSQLPPVSISDVSSKSYFSEIICDLS